RCFSFRCPYSFTLVPYTTLFRSKLMSHAGIGSRRACETIIEQGRVTVNGRVAELGMKADPAVDDIRVDGQPLKPPESYDYIMLRSEEHTSELQSRENLVCRLLLE